MEFHGGSIVVGLLFILSASGLDQNFLGGSNFASAQTSPVPNGLNPSVVVPKWFSIADGKEYRSAVYWWWADWATPETLDTLAKHPREFRLNLNVPFAYKNVGGVTPEELDATYQVDLDNHLYDSGDTCLGITSGVWNTSNVQFAGCLKDQIARNEQAYLATLGYNMTGLAAPGGGDLSCCWDPYTPPLISLPLTLPQTYWESSAGKLGVSIIADEGGNIHLFDPYATTNLSQSEELFASTASQGKLFVAGNDGVSDPAQLQQFWDWVIANYQDKIKFFTTSELAYYYYSLRSTTYNWTYSSGVYNINMELSHQIYYLPLRLEGSVYQVTVDGKDYPSFNGNYVVLGSLPQGNHVLQVRVTDSGSAYPHLINQRYYHPLPTRLRSISWTNNSTLTLLVTQDRLGKFANLTFDTSGRQVTQVEVNGASSGYSLNGNNLTVPMHYSSPVTVELQFTTASGVIPPWLNTLVLATPAILLGTTLVILIAYRRARNKKALEYPV